MLESYPFVKQEDQKECGPVCLQMIIKYYKGYIDLEYLNYLCKTNKYGTNAYNLINGAKEIGFDYDKNEKDILYGVTNCGNGGTGFDTFMVSRWDNCICSVHGSGQYHNI